MAKKAEVKLWQCLSCGKCRATRPPFSIHPPAPPTTNCVSFRRVVNVHKPLTAEEREKMIVFTEEAFPGEPIRAAYLDLDLLHSRVTVELADMEVVWEKGSAEDEVVTIVAGVREWPAKLPKEAVKKVASTSNAILTIGPEHWHNLTLRLEAGTHRLKIMIPWECLPGVKEWGTDELLPSALEDRRAP